MRIIGSSLVLTIAFCLCGCDTRKPSKQADQPTQVDAMKRDISTIESDVRLASATKRIDALEAEVEMLKTNPQTLELDLMKQRLEALEAKVYARDASTSGVEVPSATSSPRPSSAKSPIRAIPLTQPPVPVAPPLATRAATKEAQAFEKGGR